MILGKQLFVRGDLFRSKAYIAGEGDGIVSIKGLPVARQVVAFDQNTFAPVVKTWSFPDGSYVLPNLDPAKQYIVMAYDYKGDYPPVAESHITPYSRY